MDSIFFLDAEARAVFIRTIAQTIRCAYICLWSYLPNFSERLFFIDGWYNVENNQPSSSSYGSLNHRLFNDYRQTLHSIDDSFVPGLAFKTGIPYLELNELELLQSSCNEHQRKFYQEARIKSAVFLSCSSGEIEIGMCTSIPQANMKFHITSLFQQSQFNQVMPLASDQDWHSSSSSSLRSLSVGSPENPPPLLSMPRSTTSYMPEFLSQAHTEQASRPPLTSTPILPFQQQTMEAYNHLRIQHLDPESDNAAMTRAILAVISSPSCSSTSYNQTLQTSNYNPHVSPNTGAIKEYTSSSPLAPNTQIEMSSSGGENMLKRTFAVMRNMDFNWREEPAHENTLTSNSQLHHKNQERKRREKLNESFQELRSLLPPGKKDKASVLSDTVDYLSNLKMEVSELKQKNELLEARASSVRRKSEEGVGSSSNVKIDVDITEASESTSEEQEIDLRVTVRGDCNVIDLIIDVLEYLKMAAEGSLVSMNADIETTQTIPINRVIFRLKIKVNEFDKPAFQEDVRRIVTDVVNN